MTFQFLIFIIALSLTSTITEGARVVTKQKGPSSKPCNDTSELLHEETSICYPGDTQGPCHSSMKFHFDHFDDAKDQSIGKCSCRDTFHGGQSLACPRRPKLYCPSRKQCYNAYSQGPCAKSDWFVPTTEEKFPPEGVCSLKMCDGEKTSVPSNSSNAELYFSYIVNSTCFQTGTQSHCENASLVSYFTASPYDTHCDQSSVFVEPCKHIIMQAIAVPSGVLQCPKGEVLMASGSCGVVADIA